MDVQLLIDNVDCAAASGATFVRQGPVGEMAPTRAAAGGVDDACRAAASASIAFATWSATAPGERRRILLRAAELMTARAPEFAAAMTRETGATQPWGLFNAKLASDILREAGCAVTQMGGEIIPSDKPDCLSMGVRQPAGVCLGIAPWNAPVILGTRAVAMPIACGNTAVLKASELCPATHRMIGEVLRDAGLPPGVLNVVTSAPDNAGAVVEALIAHPAVRRINFTGSTRVGRIIAETAGRHLKPALLELGGKAPLIVLDDADLNAAVDAAVFGAFANSGQICMSTERIIVDTAVADAFTGKLAARARALPAGDPRGHVVLGALVSEAAACRVATMVEDAVAHGATLLAGGTRDGAVMEATLLDHVTPVMRIYSEESFGPAKSIIRVTGVEEAVRVANDTDYGLSAAVFGRDVNRAMAVARRLQTGICHINGPTVADEAQAPFGGTKGSGYGRFGGRAGIEAFTELRWITIEGSQHYPF